MIGSDRVCSINLLSFSYILLAVPLTFCNFVVREERMHKSFDLYSNHGASWEFTNLAAKTKSSNPFDLKYHCFCLCCDRFALQKPTLSTQLSAGVIIIQVLASREKSSHRRLHLLLFPTYSSIIQ